MTRGISEETLKCLIRTDDYGNDYINADEALEACTELNPWMPIDENTPKDKYLLLYSQDIEGLSKKFVGKLESAWCWKPAHWRELPHDPK